MAGTVVAVVIRAVCVCVTGCCTTPPPDVTASDVITANMHIDKLRQSRSEKEKTSSSVYVDENALLVSEENGQTG